jgi:hypothetical protein
MNKLIVLKQNSLKQKIVTLRIKNPATTGIHQQKKTYLPLSVIYIMFCILQHSSYLHQHLEHQATH